MRANAANDLREKGYVTTGEAADMLKVSRATVLRMVERGELAGTRYGGGKVPRVYVFEKSIAEHVGPAAARLLGLL